MVYRESLKLQSRDRAVSFHDVTEQVKEITAKSGMKNGICVVYSHHTTCSVITQECAFDMSMTGLETLQQDLVNVFEEWIPTCRYEGMYLHPGKKALDFAESVGEDNFGCLSADGPLSIEMEKVLSKQPGSEGVKSDKVLELNVNHPVFAVLKAAQEAGDTEKLKKYSALLYAQAQLIEGLPVDDPAAYAEAVCSLMQ